MLSGLWQRSRRRSGFFGVKGPFLVIFIEQPQHALCVALQNDPWIVRYPIIGELYAAKITVADTVAKEFRTSFRSTLGRSRIMQHFGGCFLVYRRKSYTSPLFLAKMLGRTAG